MTSGKEHITQSEYDFIDFVLGIKRESSYLLARKIIYTKHIESIEQVDSVVE